MNKSFCLILLIVISFKTHSDTITLVADQWCPLNCVPNSDIPGYGIEIAKAIYEPLGHQIEYLNLSWGRALKEVKNGSYTGVIAATPVDLPNAKFPSESIGTFGNYFFTRNNSNWQFEAIESLKSKKLAVAQGYDYGPSINAYIEAHSKGITRIGGDRIPDRGLKMLVEGRVDVYLEDRNVMAYTAMGHNLENQIEIAGTEGGITPIYIGFSAKNPNSQLYSELFDTGIRKLRKTGELQTILNKYGLQDWKSK